MIIKLFACLSFVLMAMLVLVQPISASSHCANPGLTPIEQAQCGINDPNQDQSGTKITTTLKVVLNILAFVGGVIAVIVLIVQGLRLVTSGGNSKVATEARNGIIYVIVGLIIIISAQNIISYVLNSL